MPLWLAIIAAILILGFLIFIHELGHFLAARKNGVRVERFAIGFGPRLFKKKYGDTEYSLNLLPLGGYVKLYGEDASSGKAMKAKDSFVSKTPWQRVEIIVAGVIMNLLVAIVLLTIGIGLGMDPIVADLDDFNERLSTGEIVHQPGLVVKGVRANTEVAKTNVMPGSKLISVNNQSVSVDGKGAENLLGVLETDQELVFQDEAKVNQKVYLFAGSSLIEQGLELYSPATMLRPQVSLVSENNEFGLEVDDILLSVDGKQLFTQDDLLEVSNLPISELKVIRNGDQISLTNTDSGLPTVLISDLVPESPASLANVKVDSFLLSVNGKKVNSPEQASDLLLNEPAPIVLELIEVNGDRQNVTIAEKNEGRIGVYLSETVNPIQLAQQFKFVPVLGSLVNQNELKLPWHLAPFAAVQESYRLAKVTVKGFSGVVTGLFLNLEVPDEVGGPVAVAQVTTQFLQYDLQAVIWLVAVISLSLAVINILPIPALDGGRLLFVVIEVFRGGKKIKPKFEAIVHLLGFAFLILLILIISFKDVARLLE